jgi:O-antigen ligase
VFKGMTTRAFLAGAVTIGAVGLAYLVWSKPVYFTTQTSLGGLILLELLAAAIYKFRQVFFAVLILAFLLAGATLPGASIWTSARWLFLGVGAIVGFLMLLRDRQHTFGVFHAIALFAVLAAAVSAVVSRYPGVALLKVLSLFLLFLYAASGARVAVRGREERFFAGLLLGCELLVGYSAISYLLLGAAILGNPNSLGAIAGVVGAPLLLWGALTSSEVLLRRRRLFVYALCMYLVYHSHSRASIVAAALSCGLLCVGLRRYRALVIGAAVVLILLSTSAIMQPELLFETASTITSEVVYKGPRESGVLASRQSRWQEAVDTIRSHFWFGTGFGTSDKGESAIQHIGSFSSTAAATTEYGSSYLKIATWVGMLGMPAFLLLLMGLATRVLRTLSWMRQNRDATHPAIPVAMVVISGMLHAAFEDWLFAPGYYLCVFFWCMAFLLVDYAPSRATVTAQRRPWWVPRPTEVVVRTAAPVH